MKRDAKVAIFNGPKLGDGIVGMSLAHNLQKNGYSVTSFGDASDALKALYPNFDIRPSTPHKKSQLQGFDCIIYPHQTAAQTLAPLKGQKRVCFRENKELFAPLIPVRQTYALSARVLLGLRDVDEYCPIHIPKSWKPKKYPKRVVIHPTAGESFRNWGQEHSIELARMMKAEGFEPIFIMTPKEKKEWEEMDLHIEVFGEMIEMAKLICESAFFIGTDSGPGHVAFTVGTPTLTLAYRKQVIARWMPSNQKEASILPWLPMPGPKLKAKYWKKFISPKRCFKRFKRLYS